LNYTLLQCDSISERKAMNKLLRLSTLFLLLVIPLTSNCLATTNQQTDVSDEEYAVYSSVLREQFVSERTQVVVIVNQTTGIPPYSGTPDANYFRRASSAVSQVTIDDYLTKNNQTHPLSDRFNTRVRRVLFDNAEFHRLFRDVTKGWEEFYRRFPNSGGFIRFSRVGFNVERTQALVYVEHGCGGTCGAGRYLLLAKREGVWRIEGAYMAWIS
jgi:hypothetical protein